MSERMESPLHPDLPQTQDTAAALALLDVWYATPPPHGPAYWEAWLTELAHQPLSLVREDALLSALRAAPTRASVAYAAAAVRAASRDLHIIVDGVPDVPPSPETQTLPGFLCEVCLDAPAVVLQPAPWGGEMGICVACQPVR